MLTSSTFFDALLTSIDTQPVSVNAFQCCLQRIAVQLGLPQPSALDDDDGKLSIENYHHYQDRFKIGLSPVSVESIASLRESFCPILLQTEGSQSFTLLSHETDDQVVILKAWQCYPMGFPVFSGVGALAQAIISHFKADFVATFALGCVVAMMTVLLSMVSGYLFKHLDEMHQNGHAIIFVSFFLIFVSSSLLAFQSQMRLKVMNLKLLLYILPSLWSHLVALPLSTIHRFTTGDVSQKIFDYEAALSAMLSTLLSVVFSGLALLCLLTYMMYCNTYLALLYLAISLLCTLLKLYVAPANLSAIHQMLAEKCRLTQSVNEMLLQVHKIRSSGVELPYFKRWLKHLVMYKRHAETSMQLELFVRVLESWIPITLLLVFYLSYYFYPAKTDTSLVLQFMICAGQFAGIFEKLSSTLLSFIQLSPNLKRMAPIMAEPKEAYDTTRPATFQGKGELQLSNVSLRHHDSSQLILDNVTMHLPAGKFVAIIGRSGAGKSSLFKLLLGFEAVSSGVITIDHQPLGHFNIADVRRQFGVVLQTTNILPGTIFSNLSVHAPMTHDEAWALAKMVGLDDEINAMPMKMHTYISDNPGESISGGQKQKILIARALAGKPRILLLDEATSALDNHSQSLIFNNLKAMNITRVVIAHRFSTIVAADIIYQLEGGRVMDTGSYTDLARRGAFSI